MGRNNKDFLSGNGEAPKENATQEKLESMFSSAGVKMIKDPFTGTTHVDLSDPNHPFWTGKPGNGSK